MDSARADQGAGNGGVRLLRALGWRYWLAAAFASILVALLTGIPTDVLPNPWFTRMTPVRTLDLVYWPVTSVLVGLLFATFVLPKACRIRPPGTTGIVSGALAWFAIGCPICNKLVVALLGISGALSTFAPIQPFLGAFAILLSAFALWVRLRMARPVLLAAPLLAA